jgi:hypothetical protein
MNTVFAIFRIDHNLSFVTSQIHEKELIDVILCCFPAVLMLYIQKKRSLNLISEVVLKASVLVQNDRQPA